MIALTFVLAMSTLLPGPPASMSADQIRQTCADTGNRSAASYSYRQPTASQYFSNVAEGALGGGGLGWLLNHAKGATYGAPIGAALALAATQNVAGTVSKRDVYDRAYQDCVFQYSVNYGLRI